jgi:hypothetical protein
MASYKTCEAIVLESIMENLSNGKELMSFDVFKIFGGKKCIEKMTLADAQDFTTTFMSDYKLADLVFSLECTCNNYAPEEDELPSSNSGGTQEQILEQAILELSNMCEMKPLEKIPEKVPPKKTKIKNERNAKVCTECCDYKFLSQILILTEHQMSGHIVSMFYNLSQYFILAEEFCNDVIMLYKRFHVDLSDFSYVVKLAFQLGNMPLILHILSLKKFDNQTLRELTCLAALNAHEEVYSYMTSTDVSSSAEHLAKSIILSNDFDFIEKLIHQIPYASILVEVAPRVDIKIIHHLVKIGADISHNNYQVISEAIYDYRVSALVYLVKVSDITINHSGIVDSMKVVINARLYEKKRAEHDAILDFLERESFNFSLIPNAETFLHSVRFSRAMSKSEIIKQFFTQHEWSTADLKLFSDLKQFANDQHLHSNKQQAASYIYDVITNVHTFVRPITKVDADSLFPHIITHLDILDYLYNIAPFDKELVKLHVSRTYFPTTTAPSLSFIIKNYGIDIIDQMTANNLLKKMVETTKVLIRENVVTLSQLINIAELSECFDFPDPYVLSDSDSDRWSISDFDSDLDLDLD